GLTSQERTTPPTRPASRSADKPADTLAVSGRVLGPDGKPFAGAKLYLRPFSGKAKDSTPTTSGGDGSFRFTFPPPPAHAPPAAPGSGGGGGLGGWGRGGPVARSAARAAGLPRRRVPALPIRGRVVDLNGKPVQGVTVRLEEISSFEDTEAFLQSVRDREWPL